MQPGADHRHSQRDRRQGGPQPDAGQQVVGQRVAEETLEHGQNQQQRTDDPVGLARPPKRSGEEDPGQVHHDGRGEHQRGPVMDLANEQAAAHLETDVERGRVGLRHLHAAQRLIHAVVGDIVHGGVEEQRQVDTGQQQDDEAVHRDLTEQEGPMRREDLVELAAHRSRGVITRVDVLTLTGQDVADVRRTQFWTHDVVRSQNAGPTGSMKSPLATRYPSASMVRGSCANARAAGPKIGVA